MKIKKLLPLTICLTGIFVLSICADRLYADADFQSGNIGYYVVISEDQTFAYPEPSDSSKEKKYLDNGDCLLTITTPDNQTNEWIPIYVKSTYRNYGEYRVRSRDVQKSEKCKIAYELFSSLHKEIKPVIEKSSGYDYDDKNIHEIIHDDLVSALNGWAGFHLNEAIETETNTARAIENGGKEENYEEVIVKQTASIEDVDYEEVTIKKTASVEDAKDSLADFIFTLLVDVGCLGAYEDDDTKYLCMDEVKTYLTINSVYMNGEFIVFNHGACSCHQSWWYFRQENGVWKVFKMVEDSF